MALAEKCPLYCRKSLVEITCPVCGRSIRIENPKPETEPITQKYYDLIMCVKTKTPGKSRHETAKRYIMERENKTEGSCQQEN